MSFLPDKAIKEFQNIYKRKCGEELSFEDATVKAEDFIRFFDLITQIPKKK